MLTHRPTSGHHNSRDKIYTRLESRHPGKASERERECAPDYPSWRAASFPSASRDWEPLPNQNLRPSRAAYVLILAVAGPIITRFSDNISDALEAWQERSVPQTLEVAEAD
jgi:hypothetical protein